MLIRNAEQGDLEVIAGWAKEFMEYYPMNLKYDMEELLHTLIGVAQSGIFLIAEKDGKPVGALGALVAPNIYSSLALVCTELFLWVDKDQRNSTVGPRLLKELEYTSQEIGCTHITMTSTVHTPNFKKYLVRRGYSETETSFMKEI